MILRASSSFLRALCLTGALCLSGALVSCGIDDFAFLYPPETRLHDPASSVDPANKFYEFVTPDEVNAAEADDFFKGFEIYYRIYSDNAVLSQDATSINDSNEKNPTQIINVLQGRGYKRMTRVSGSSMEGAPLIERSASNREILIRLTTEGAYLAEFTVDGTAQNTVKRSTSETSWKAFDYAQIAAGDGDVNAPLTVIEPDAWYVQAYALTYGYDLSYRSLYSKALSLGVIVIAKE